jgi:hypothetical protein
LGQSRKLLDKGFFVAVRKCLAEYGGYRFETAVEDLVEGGSSKVDYVALADDRRMALCEAKSPSVMKKVGQLLPARGIELSWIPASQSLVRRILTKVGTLFSINYNVGPNKICVVCVVSGPETDGMVVSFLPQLLDCMPSCERCQASFSCVLANDQYRRLL